MTAAITPSPFIAFSSKPSSITSSTKNNNFSKIQETALKSLIYVKDAIKVFLLDTYSSFFSWKIITKIPFFIFFYGFWTAFGAIDTIYYVFLTIFVLKASKDLLVSLKQRNLLKHIKEYFPLASKSQVLTSLIKGVSVGTFLFALDRYLTQFVVKILQLFKLKVFNENKLIYQSGFLGGFSTFYAILIYPVIKEVLFRGYIETYFSNGSKNKIPNIFFKTAIKTSIIFGIYHFSPTVGLLNIPIIVVNIALGLVNSLLNKNTSDLWASTSCSIMQSFVLTFNLRYLKFS